MENNSPGFISIDLLIALAGWFGAQTIKLINIRIREKRFDLTAFVSTGGMPSAHSAFVSALATSIGINYGFDSGSFAIATVFALIVMFDAQSVRKAVGDQAAIINKIMEEKKVKAEYLHELLGHTRLQVFAGMLLGILIAVLLAF